MVLSATTLTCMDHAPPTISWMWPWAVLPRAADNDILRIGRG